MIPGKTSATSNANDEIAALIEVLLATEQRLEELTAGEVDTVASHDGRTFLLRRAQEDVRRSEAVKQAAALNELRVLFDLVPAMIWFKDTENNILRVNKRVAEAIGFPVERIEGKSTHEIFPQEADAYYADDLEVIRSKAPKLGIIEKLRGQKDRELWVETDKVPVCDKDGKVTGLIAMVHDITERKRTETALLESKRFLRSTLDALSDHITILDGHGTIVAANAAWKSFAMANNFMGNECGVGDNYLQVCDAATGKFSAEAPAVASGIRAIIGGQRDTFTMEYPCHSPQEKRWFVLRVTRFGDDGTLRVVVSHQNITERKQIEARFRRLVDSNAQGVLFWNTKGQITEANDAFLHLVGYTRADLEAGSLDWTAMTPPKYASLDQAAMKQIAAKGSCVPYEKEYICKDGLRVPIFIGAAAFEDNPGEGVCFVFDLTERKKLEAQFRQSQKMEAIGTLAGGVAHDFNNILAVIQMQAGLLKSDGGLSPQQAELAGDIGGAVQRAAGLTRQLLLFSRKEVLQLRDLDLNQSVKDMVKMLTRILGENIAVQIKLATQPMLLHGDAGMVDQVLMNLVVNARDAMPDGGQLVIETAGVEFDEFAATQTAQARPGSFVRLSVSDNGCGIPPENLAKIFEPFFTTKGVGKGTGLGLATVFSIAQQHQGWVNVYSETGQGAIFKVYLPRLAELHDTKFIQILPATAQNGHETILLVEDEPALRTMMGKALSRLGYRVLEASTGVKALEVWIEHHGEVHLLITDLMLPDGMTGKDLGQRLLQEKPKLKVIYMSGYSADLVAKDFPLQEGVNFLIKPFPVQQLAQTIRQCLDGPAVGM